MGGSVVAGGGEAAGIQVEGPDAFLFVEEGGSVVGGAIVDDDDFEVGVVDSAAGIEAGDKAIGSVTGADDNGETRGIFWERIGKDEVSKGGKNGFFREVAAQKAEGPFVHAAVVVKPVI